MQTVIRRWGNSQGIRIPKAIMIQAGLEEDDLIKLEVEAGKIIIKPYREKLTLRERMAAYDGDYKGEEWDTGLPTGDEEW
jgi:antitoxin MazE